MEFEALAECNCPTVFWWSEAEVQSLSFPDFDGPILMGFWWAFPFPHSLRGPRFTNPSVRPKSGHGQRMTRKNVYHILWDLCMTLRKLVDSCATPPLATNTAWLECIWKDVEKPWEAMRSCRENYSGSQTRAHEILYSHIICHFHIMFSNLYPQADRNDLSSEAEKSLQSSSRNDAFNIPSNEGESKTPLVLAAGAVGNGPNRWYWDWLHAAMHSKIL